MARSIKPKLYISVKTQVLDFLKLAQNANKMSFPLNFNNNFKGLTLFGPWVKNVELPPDTPSDTSFQNNVLVSLHLFPFGCY